jgi:hypothetical protein
MTPEQLEEGLHWATHQIGSWPMTVRRAWKTWASTGNLWMTALALVWNRSGLYQRVASHRHSRQKPAPEPEQSRWQVPGLREDRRKSRSEV